MKKLSTIAAFAFIALISGCSGCATAPGAWGRSSDPSELQRQDEMRESLLVKNQVVYMAPPGSEKPLGVRNWGGTGFVVAVDRKSHEALVMTAAHVCAVPDSVSIEMPDGSEVEMPTILNSYTLQDIEGDWHAAKQVYSDERTDVCVLAVSDLDTKKVVSISSSVPPLGGRLETAGAPGGEYDWHSSTLQEGFMTGFEVFGDHTDVTYLKTSIPVMGGASGSAVYYRGKVVGMVARVHSRFHHISYLVEGEHLKSALSEAKKRWHPESKQQSQPSR